MQQITNLSTSILKVHPQNKDFFDDIEGEQYDKFKKSIQEDGIITPLIVSPDMTIISGHQRYKASKDLGIELVPVIINESLIDEDDKLKKLLAANFGRLKTNPVKQGKVFLEYERLSGIYHGNHQKVSGNNCLSQEDIAKELGVSVRTLRNLKQLQTLSPELQQLIEDGSVKYTTALNVYAKLSPIEQSQLIEELGKDKIAEMTQKQTEQYLLEKKILEQSLNDLSKKYSTEISKEPITVEIDNTDYTSIIKLEKDLKYAKDLFDNKKQRVEILEGKIKIQEENSAKYIDLKAQIELLIKEKDDIGRQIESVTELSGYIVEIKSFLKTKLAPIQYSQSLLDSKDNPIVVKNITEIIKCVEKWCQETRKYLPKEQQNIINVEVL